MYNISRLLAETSYFDELSACLFKVILGFGLNDLINCIY